jgi:nucleoside-diphosphate-sugar epimerase
MKFVVTAAGGFIGSALVRRLMTCGHEVISIDTRECEGTEIIQERTKNVGLEKLFEGAEAVFHLEWTGMPRSNRDEAETAARFNGETLEKVVDACTQTGTFCVFTSSSIVYAGESDRAVTEQEDIGPKSPYGHQKLLAEQFLQQSGIRFCATRVFNIYGPGKANPVQIIPRIVSAILENQPVKLTGDGLQTRDFLFIDDAVDGLIRLGQGQPISQSIFNLCSGVGTSLLDLVEIAHRVVGKESRIEFLPAVDGESRFLVGDCSRLRNLAAWTPSVGLEKGLTHLLS